MLSRRCGKPIIDTAEPTARVSSGRVFIVFKYNAAVAHDNKNCNFTTLGYDLHPNVTHWNGTPIPPVDRPLALTDKRAAICRNVWWWGGPEIALRNCCFYLYHVIDYGTFDEIKFTMKDVTPEIWQYALGKAKEGQVSHRGHRLLSIWMGADPSLSDCWRDVSNKFDMRRRYEQTYWREWRKNKLRELT